MYESFFGLTRLPFQLSPDRSFLFEGKGHRDTLAAVRHGLASGARVMLVTGEVGAGKTTLLHALVQGVDAESTTAVLTSAARLDADTLVDRLSDALGLPASTAPHARRDALYARLESAAPGVFLIIDEAQHLEPSALELLETMTSAASNAAPRLQVCLVGQPELRMLLSVPERARFREQIVVDRHLGVLEQDETRAYVEHRLQRAGWDGRPRFEDGAFLAIFVFTSGIPRRINQLCNSLLFSACLNREETIDASAVTREAMALRAGSFPVTPDMLHMQSHVEKPPTPAATTEPILTHEHAVAGADGAPASPLAGGDMPSDRRWTGAVDVDVSRDAPELPQETAAPGDRAMPEAIDLGPRRADESALAGRRRRQAILPITASATIATALIAYAMNHQGVRVASLANEPRNAVAKGSVTPAEAASAVAAPASATPGATLPSVALPPASALPSPAPTDAAATATGAASRKPAPVAVPPARDREASAERAAAERRRATGIVSPADVPGPAPEATPCSAQALALGLCATDSPPSPRP